MTTRTVLFALLAATVATVAAACGSSSPTPVGPGGPGGGDVDAAPPVPTGPGSHYAALFEQGRSWTYDVVAIDEFYDDEDPAANESGVVRSENPRTATCTVVEVTPLADARAARIDCNGGLEALEQVFVATDAGLWRVYDAPTDDTVRELAPQDMVIAASPKAGTEHIMLDEEMGFEEAIVVAEKDGGWCVTASAAAGDEAWTEMCFVAGRGVVSGNWGWAGGAVQETRYTLAK